MNESYLQALELQSLLVTGLRNTPTLQARRTLQEIEGKPIDVSLPLIANQHPELFADLFETTPPVPTKSIVDQLIEVKERGLEQLRADYHRCKTELARAQLLGAIRQYESDIERMAASKL